MLDPDLMFLLVELDSKGKIREALDLLYDSVDASLHEGHESQSWPDIEKLLSDLRWTWVSTQLLVGALVITLPVKDKLLCRSNIVKAIRRNTRNPRKEKEILGGLT